jgi:iron complex outermembrane receptor protein
MCFGSLNCFSVNSSSDTTYLEEIVVESGRLLDFLPGVNSMELNNDSLNSFSFVDNLSKAHPVYFIQYGATGQLSSLNLRGLGSSRSSLIWNGLEINSFSLGQTDFGVVEPWASQSLTLSTGSASALYGNGAIGGTLSLNSKPRRPDSQIHLRQALGSFGHRATRVSYSLTEGNWFFSGKGYLQHIENDFSYPFADSSIIQDNAEYKAWGFTQDIGYKNKRNEFHLAFWLHDNFREIQPGKGNFNNHDDLSDQNIRTTLSWTHTANRVIHTNRLGYTADKQIFNQESRTYINRFHYSYSADWSFLDLFVMKSGIKVDHLITNVDAYENTEQETRYDVFQSILWDVSEDLKIGANFRQPFVNSEAKAFSPSVSAEYQFVNVGFLRSSALAIWDRSFRLPTLNDRFWNPGGNPNLNAEISRNVEAGLNIESEIDENISLNLNGRYFRHDVDNWIIWIPGGRDINDEGDPISFWYPDNIREVLAQGAEFTSELTYRHKSLPLKASVQYQGTFTRALNKNTLNQNDRSFDKQLPYTPEWVRNTNINLEFKGWFTQAHNTFISERFTEANNELPPLPEYSLWNIGFGKTMDLKKFSIGLYFEMRNLGDVDYENFENRAMPGRNYLANIEIRYNLF